HSEGDVLGFALVLPRDIEQSERRSVLRAVAAFAAAGSEEEFLATIQMTRDSAWQLQRTAMPSRASLRPRRWCGTSCVWMSATPVLLDRFPDNDDPLEIGRVVARSCSNIGLPEPIEIEIHKHSAVNGASSSYPARTRNSPDWSFPADSKLRNR